MGIKKNVLILTLLTGAVVSSPISNLYLSNQNIADLVYGVSCDYSYDSQIVLTTDIDIPVVNAMVPQGLSILDEYFLMSSYDYLQKENSCIFVLDKSGEVINTCTLDNKAHVGGIAYDKNNQLIWVTVQNGCVSAYDVEQILNNEYAYPRYSNLDIGEDLVNYKNPFLESASFLTVYNGHLFVGNFNLSNKGIVKEYSIYIDKDTNLLTLFYVRQFFIPNKVQSLSFYNKDDSEYIIFGKSYGKWASSQLEIFRYSQDIDNYNDSSLISVSFGYPSMMEQIVILDDKIYSAYESCALPYSRGDEYDTDCLTVTDMDNLVKKLQIKEDTIN